MIRVIAGKYKGRRLETPEAQSLRPLRSRVRESLFNILGPSIHGLRFLELCAGTGAVGIEALSRGAELAVMVEQDPRHVDLIVKNLKTVGETGEHSRVVRGDVAHFKWEGEPFDVIFLAPPYASDVYEPALRRIVEQELLSPDGRLVVEHTPDRTLEVPAELTPGRVYRYGRTCLSLFELQ